jgi:fatty-acyl-CoA synthase
MDNNAISTSAHNLKSVFSTALRKHEERVAVTFRGTHYTYDDLECASNAIANSLVNRGIESEDRVAILMGNRPEFITTELATLKTNATKVMLNDMLAADEIKYIIEDSRASVLVCGPEFIDLAKTLYASVDTLSDIICIADGNAIPDEFTTLETLQKRGDDTSTPARSSAPDDIIVHSYTGGTTGKPKGVLHSQQSRSMLYYSAMIELGISREDTLLITTPLPHSAGSFVRAGLLQGATIILRSGFEAKQTLQDIEEHGVSWTFMVPTMVYRLLDQSGLSDYDLSSLEHLVYGAAPMKADRLQHGIDLFGPVFKQFYGQTEVPNLITTLEKEDHERAIAEDQMDILSSAGRECLMADIRIVDPETGERQPTGEPGEIQATAPYMMEEYFERPEQTAETLEDGWVRTGDIGKRDENGFVTLLDRMSNLIISGGMNVYSTEVEDVLVKHGEVQDAAVIGVPDEEWGEAVKAIVVPRDPETFSKDDLQRFTEERLANYKKPKSITTTSDLPTTPYGKIDKNALAEDYWAEEDRQIN